MRRSTEQPGTSWRVGVSLPLEERELLRLGAVGANMLVQQTVPAVLTVAPYFQALNNLKAAASLAHAENVMGFNAPGSQLAADATKTKAPARGSGGGDAPPRSRLASNNMTGPPGAKGDLLMAWGDGPEGPSGASLIGTQPAADGSADEAALQHLTPLESPQSPTRGLHGRHGPEPSLAPTSPRKPVGRGRARRSSMSHLSVRACVTDLADEEALSQVEFDVEVRAHLVLKGRRRGLVAPRSRSPCTSPRCPCFDHQVWRADMLAGVLELDGSGQVVATPDPLSPAGACLTAACPIAASSLACIARDLTSARTPPAALPAGLLFGSPTSSIPGLHLSTLLPLPPNCTPLDLFKPLPNSITRAGAGAGGGAHAPQALRASMKSGLPRGQVR